VGRSGGEQPAPVPLWDSIQGRFSVSVAMLDGHFAHFSPDCLLPQGGHYQHARILMFFRPILVLGKSAETQ
jgi:hypothetical protein